MKKFKILILIAVAACLLFQTACSANTIASMGNFSLSHYSGVDSSKDYDSELLYINDDTLKMADTGVIWVSEEENSEYGGWYYQYGSQTGSIGASYSTFVGEDGNTYREAVQVVRSRDLVDWEICGAVDSGMGLLIGKDEWVYDKVWAPEVVYDKESGRYFMYFAAQVQELTESLINKGARYTNVYDKNGNRHYQSEMHLGIAVSDTPVGPFRLVSSENVYGDASAKNPVGQTLSGMNPPIMFSEYFDMEWEFAIIDAHPYFDENGDFYLLFVKHKSLSTEETEDDQQRGNHIWGVKMLDMVTPDYTTITKLLSPFTFTSVTYKGADQHEWDDEYPRNLDLSYEHSINYPDGSMMSGSDRTVSEAPNLLTTKDENGNTVYILTYAPRGVGNYDYDILYAYSHNILGPYTKVPRSEGKAIMEYDDECNDFNYSVGHAQFLTIGEETWVVYATKPLTSGNSQRVYALDRVEWKWTEVMQPDYTKLSIRLPVAVGPTKTLQPKAEEICGYRNVAKDAEITVSSGEGAEYLNDGLVSTTKFYSGLEFSTEEDKVTVTLKFAEPTTVRGILIYNSYDYWKAFKSVDSVCFNLAETPESYKKGIARSCFIKDLEVDPWTINVPNTTMRPGGGAVATFDEIKVDSITITISNKVAGSDAIGIAISDIYVIGK